MFELIETIKFRSLEILHKMQTLEFLRELREDKRGVTAMEYGLIAALIGVVAATTINGIGGKVLAKFTTVLNALQ